MLVIPRKRQQEVEEEDDVINRKRSKKKVFEEFAQIGYRNDSCHSIYQQLPTKLKYVKQVISKELVSFLNTSGGILCFGAKPSGHVYGQEMSRKDEDVYRCTIDEVVKRIHPMINPGMYRLSFTPVTSSSRSRSSVTSGDRGLFVLEIRVQQGDRFQLYETGGSYTMLRGERNISQSFLRDGWKIKGPLDPHQIKERVTHLFFEKLKHEAQLASKLLPQSKLVIELHSACNALRGTEKLGVAPQMATARCCKSKANDAAIISYMYPLPSTSSLLGGSPVKAPSQQPLVSLSTHLNETSSLLKSIKKTVLQTFPAENKPGTSSVIRDVINSENTFVKERQPERAVPNSMRTRLKRRVRCRKKKSDVLKSIEKTVSHTFPAENKPGTSSVTQDVINSENTFVMGEQLGRAVPNSMPTRLKRRVRRRNKKSGLLKSIKQTVSQTFPAENIPGTSSVTQDVIKSENTFVMGGQPGRAVPNSMPTRLKRRVRRRHKKSGLLKSIKKTVSQTFPAENKPGTLSVTQDVVKSENTFIMGGQPGRAVPNSMPTRLKRRVRRRNKKLGLLKLIKKTVSQIFPAKKKPQTSSVTQDVINSERTFVKERQSERAVPNSMATGLQRIVSGIKHGFVTHPPTKVFTADPIPYPPPITHSSHQVVDMYMYTRTVYNNLAPPLKPQENVPTKSALPNPQIGHTKSALPKPQAVVHTSTPQRTGQINRKFLYFRSPARNH